MSILLTYDTVILWSFLYIHWAENRRHEGQYGVGIFELTKAWSRAENNKSQETMQGPELGPAAGFAHGKLLGAAVGPIDGTFLGVSLGFIEGAVGGGRDGWKEMCVTPWLLSAQLATSLFQPTGGRRRAQSSAEMIPAECCLLFGFGAMHRLHFRYGVSFVGSERVSLHKRYLSVMASEGRRGSHGVVEMILTGHTAERSKQPTVGCFESEQKHRTVNSRSGEYRCSRAVAFVGWPDIRLVDSSGCCFCFFFFSWEFCRAFYLLRAFDLLSLSFGVVVANSVCCDGKMVMEHV